MRSTGFHTNEDRRAHLRKRWFVRAGFLYVLVALVIVLFDRAAILGIGHPPEEVSQIHVLHGIEGVALLLALCCGLLRLELKWRKQPLFVTNHRLWAVTQATLVGVVVGCGLAILGLEYYISARW